MNRYFYGSLHGLPLKILERHAAFEKYIVLKDGMDFGVVDWDDHLEMQRRRTCLNGFRRGVFDQRPEGPAAVGLEKPWRFSYDYAPRIINDELYIARFHRIDGPLVSWKQLTALLGSIHLPICHHLEVVAEYYGDILIQHTDRPVSFAYVVFDEEAGEESGSCPDCFADYDFSLTRDEVKKEWSLRFSTYHCLGSCRSPYDPTWRRLLNGDPPASFNPDENLIQSGNPHSGRAQRQWYESLDAEYASRF